MVTGPASDETKRLPAQVSSRSLWCLQYRPRSSASFLESWPRLLGSSAPIPSRLPQFPDAIVPEPSHARVLSNNGKQGIRCAIDFARGVFPVECCLW